MNNSRLTLTNRPENLKILLDFVRRWAKDQDLPVGKLHSLELAAGEVFRHLLDHAYQPDEPGSITVELVSKGPRLRLMFEDDAPPRPNPVKGQAAAEAVALPLTTPNLNGLQHLAESLIYYRTTDRKNRLVVFLN